MKFLGYELIKEQNDKWIYSVTSDFEEATINIEKGTYRANITDMPYTFDKIYSKEYIISTIINILKKHPGIESCAMGSG